MIQLNYREAKPIYEQIQDGLRRLVISNSFLPNEKLPSVRELSAKLAINPNTIQKAYHELETEGYIYTISGKGTYVADRTKVPETRNEELLEKFDEIVTELLYLSTDHTELFERIKGLAKGGEAR